MLSELELRALVANTGLPTGERRDAATLLVRLLVEAVSEPGDDDPEVARLRQPWADAEKLSKVTLGRSHGYSLADAKAAVHRQRKQKVLKSMAADQTQDVLVRDGALTESQRIISAELAWWQRGWTAAGIA